MEKNITFTAAQQPTAFNVRNLVATLVAALPSPRIRLWGTGGIEWLSHYYSTVLERPVSKRLTWALLEAQTAFFLGIVPAAVPMIVRLIALGWFFVAVKRCRRLGIQASTRELKIKN